MVGFAWAYSLRLCADQDLGIRSDRVTCRHKNLNIEDAAGDALKAPHTHRHQVSSDGDPNGLGTSRF